MMQETGVITKKENSLKVSGKGTRSEGMMSAGAGSFSTASGR